LKTALIERESTAICCERAREPQSDGKNQHGYADH